MTNVSYALVRRLPLTRLRIGRRGWRALQNWARMNDQNLPSTLGELASLTPRDLLGVPGCGHGTVELIDDELGRFNLRLRHHVVLRAESARIERERNDGPKLA